MDFIQWIKNKCDIKVMNYGLFYLNVGFRGN